VSHVRLGSARGGDPLTSVLLVKGTLFGSQRIPNAPPSALGTMTRVPSMVEDNHMPESTISPCPLLHTANPPLSRPAFYHRAITMSPSSTTDQDPAPFLDDQDESVRIAIKALGDMRNSRPQPSGSNPARVYNSPPPLSFARLLIMSTRVPVFAPRPRSVIFILTLRLRRRCEFSRLCRPRINNTSRKHRPSSLRTNQSELESCQSTILSFTLSQLSLPLLNPVRYALISRLR